MLCKTQIILLIKITTILSILSPLKIFTEFLNKEFELLTNARIISKTELKSKRFCHIIS